MTKAPVARFSWLLILTETFRAWNNDNVPRLSAALSYYTIFSLAPLLVIATAIGAWFFGADKVTGQITTSMRATIGENGS